MLTIYADPVRRYRTENGGLRFLLEPISFQAAHHLAHEQETTENGGLRFLLEPISFQAAHHLAHEQEKCDRKDFNINVIFEPRDASASLRNIYRDVPSHIGVEATTIFPEPLSRLMIACYNNAELSQDVLSDIERAFSSPHLKVALTWTDRSGGRLEEIGAWLVGSETSTPDKFWSGQFPEIALVKQH